MAYKSLPLLNFCHFRNDCHLLTLFLSFDRGCLVLCWEDEVVEDSEAEDTDQDEPEAEVETGGRHEVSQV